ncbi:MAG: sigma-70 family RNA polymerase sigma factor [Eubacteriales bacterium]|nr:sigma-70 family RNA polymerase sigma factor [Eubacteriales bacterium]
MDDKQIVALYWARSEQAIVETAGKYGSLCYCIAYNVLENSEDAEESVNDTYFTTWNRLPPHRPTVLSAFLSKLTRCIAIDRWRRRSSARRGGGQVPLALHELEDCVSGVADVESEYFRKEAVAAFNGFLETLPDTERRVFLRRYFTLDSLEDIAGRFGFTQSKVKSMLHRTRTQLRQHMKEEGYL